MKKVFSFIIRQSVAIVLAVIFIIGFGVYSTLKMPVNLLPDINVPMVCVQVIYPGANAQSVEEDVTGKLEDGLSAIAGVSAVDSYSYDNLSAVVLSFDYGTDTGKKQSEIEGKISSIDLPDGVTVDVYDIDLNAEALAKLSLTSDGRPDAAYSAAQELAAKLSSIDGVESVEIKGGPKKIWSIRPFGGLELTAPLFVQAFSYEGLDIPLGDIIENGNSVQIKNNSKITCEDDIYDMPVALPSSIASVLSNVRQIADYFEGTTAEELADLNADLQGGVLTVLSEIGEKSADELKKIAELRTYINVAENFTAEQLTNFKTSRLYGDLYEAVTNPPAEDGGDRTPKTEEELEEIVESLKGSYPLFSQYITVDMLKVVSNNKLGDIIAFREWLEATDDYQTAYSNGEYYSFKDSDYIKLARDTGVYGEDVAEEEILQNVDFAKKTSAAGLMEIARKKDGDVSYNPTDSECALLFAGTTLSSEHPIVMSPTFMSFVRAESYEENMQTLIDLRKEFGEDVDAEEYCKLYAALDLTEVFELKLSDELIKFIVEPDRDFNDLSDSGELVVKVSDIATVEYEEEYSSYVYFGDSKMPTIIRGTIIEIYKSNGANSSAVVKDVKSVYSQYLAGKEGIRIELLDDQSEFISDSIVNVLVSMVIGGILAVLVIFVFLKKVKTSLIIAVTMPLSVLASIICLSLAGITLNMVSLGGLAVGIGMLVDNSIVVIESISKHRDMDKTAFQAAVDGTCEVGGALFGSTVTTVCVFIPIIFSGGLTGEIFTDLSLAVIFSLALSLIVAVTVIPALYAMLCGDKKMLKGGKLSPAPQKEEHIEISQEQALKEQEQTEEAPLKKRRLAALKEPRVMNGITAFYGRLLPKVLNKKIIPIISAVVIFGASVGLLFLTGTEFLPSIDKGQIEINMTYESGTPLKDIMEDVSDFAEKVEGEFKNNLQYISVSVGKHGLLALTDTGLITVQLKSNRSTNKTVNKIRKMAESDADKFAGRKGLSVRQIDGVVASLMSGSDDLSVTILGEDNDRLVDIAEQIMAELEKKGFTDLKSSAADKEWQTDIKFDRTAMANFGLDYQTVVLTLRIGIASYTACTATIDGEEYSVDISFDKDSVTDLNSLREFIVGFDSSGNAIKLKQIADISKPKEVDACIRRSDGKRMVSVSGVLPGVDTGTAGDRMKDVAAKVLKRSENAGYTFKQSGISSYLNDAFQGLAIALVISFFLLYAVMAIQFASAVKPLIIMAGIPFSFTGGFLALVITGSTLNVVSFIGLIMLMGVIVNNAIVMLEKIKQLKDSGMSHYDAVQEGCKVRLRPIFMTTLTTVLALIPLAIGVGQGAELMQPLGLVVIGGLIIGTLVTLILVPAVYCAVYRLSAKYPNGKKAAANRV